MVKKCSIHNETINHIYIYIYIYIALNTTTTLEMKGSQIFGTACPFFRRKKKKLHEQNQTHTHPHYKIFTNEKKYNATCLYTKFY